MFVCSVCRLQEDSDYIFNDNTDTSALLEPQAHALIKHLARWVLEQSSFKTRSVNSVIYTFFYPPFTLRMMYFIHSVYTV